MLKYRRQTDSDEQHAYYGALAAIDCTDSRDTARQEFKDETDINKILDKFGAFAPQRQVTYGEVNYDLDMQQSFDAVRYAERSWHRLPDHLKKEMPTPRTMLNAIASGKFKEYLPTKSQGDTPDTPNVTPKKDTAA